MEVIKQLIPVGHPNRPGVKLEALKAIGFHFTANDKSTATDTMNAKYFARAYCKVGNEFFESNGKGEPLCDRYGNKVAFRYGSTQILADMDSVTMAIPPDEAAWAWGDRQLDYNNGYKGQMRAARVVFNHRQNYQAVNVEICNNDAVRDSLADWEGACANAARWAVDFIKSKGLKVNVDKSLNPQAMVLAVEPGEILLLRHFDVTGKLCPGPMVEDRGAWVRFMMDIAAKV